MTKVSENVAPAYNILRIPVDDIVSQKVNPNKQKRKAWENLQRSILNTGYAAAVLVGPNDIYDPSTEGQPKPNLIEYGDGEETQAGDIKVGTQMSIDEIGKFFKYRLIDGSHRTQIVRIGKYYYENGYDYVKSIFEEDKLPQKPGPEMLAFIAYRENFTVPCAYVEIDEKRQMSSEVLLNSARGSHSLESTQDLIARLIKSGKTKEWIAKNLGMNVDEIERMQNKTGLKGDYSNLDGVSDAWDSSEDDSYGRKLQAFLTREATTFINKYTEDNPDNELPSVGSATEVAEELGWNYEEAVKKFEERN